MVVCINELNPEKHVKCGDDLIAAGVDAIIQAPADPASFKAVVDKAAAKGIPVVNDGSPQPKMPGVVPFIGTDSLGGGRLAGEFAADWINKNLGGQAVVAELTLPTFTDCVARNKGFDEALAEKAPGAKIVARQDGNGLRPKSLEVTENMLQGNPDINVIFGCNDDSALGALSALQAKGKDPAKTLVIGFDGTDGAFREIKNGGMFRADIVQRPDLISRRQMEIAVQIARGEKKVEDFPDPTYIKTPVVTTDNVEQWLQWGGDPAKAPKETAAPAAAGKKVKIGVIQITLQHEYQVTLNNGFKAQAAEMGAEVVVCINELNPEKHVKCGDDLIAAGVDAIIQAPADPASFKAVVDKAAAKGIPVVNDGSPQPKMPGVVPFIGTDSLGGGRLAGEFAADWINKNLGGQAVVAELTLPTFTDCVARNKGFDEALAEKAPGAKIVARQDGNGLRPKSLEVTENMLQGNPDINVIFGCNDDSALGALSALQAKGKDPAKTLVIGFDGTDGAFREIKNGGMFRADIVQRPDLISRRQMEIAVQIARGEKKVEDFPDATYIKTPVVTTANVEQWLQWGGDPAKAPKN